MSTSPGDQAAQLRSAEGILGGSDLSLFSPEPCDLSWLPWACLTGFLEEGAHGPRLWGWEEEGRPGALLLPETPTLQHPSWL